MVDKRRIEKDREEENIYATLAPMIDNFTLAGKNHNEKREGEIEKERI
jgi:hypothetical protein